MIRFLCVAIFLVVFLVASIPLLFLEWVIGYFNMDFKNRSSLAIVNWAFGVIIFLAGTKITVLGEENVPKDEPVLYVANHRSYFDIVLTYVRVPRPTGYISKKEIERFPLLRNWMRNLYCLFLDRDDIKQGLQIILQAIQYAKDGISIGIFPEGTRNKGDALTLLPFKEGSFKIALKSGCPIVPVAIVYDGPVFEDHIPKLKKTNVIIEYCAPIYPDQLDKEDKKGIGATCQTLIQETIRKNAKELGN